MGSGAIDTYHAKGNKLIEIEGAYKERGYTVYTNHMNIYKMKDSSTTAET